MKILSFRNIVLILASFMGGFLALYFAPATPDLFYAVIISFMGSLPMFLAASWLVDNVHGTRDLLNDVNGKKGNFVMVWKRTDAKLIKQFGNGGYFRNVKKVPLLPLYYCIGNEFCSLWPAEMNSGCTTGRFSCESEQRSNTPKSA